MHVLGAASRRPVANRENWRNQYAERLRHLIFCVASSTAIQSATPHALRGSALGTRGTRGTAEAEEDATFCSPPSMCVRYSRAHMDKFRPESFLPLTPVAFEILLALADGERHGYSILQEVESRSGGRRRRCTPARSTARWPGCSKATSSKSWMNRRIRRATTNGGAITG